MVRSRTLPLFAAVALAALAAGWSVVAQAGMPVAHATTPVADPPDEFVTKITPFVNTYCMPCHNADKAAGGLSLDGFQSTAHAKKDRKTWATVAQLLSAGEMPPKNKKQPTKAETAAVVDWVENALVKVDCGAPKDPGRVTLRRLNRAEYNNTVRDLCGVSVTPADDFPADDAGYGFDNIGDVLSVQPVLLEKYLAAADQVLAAALTRPAPAERSVNTFRIQNLRLVPREAKVQVNGRDRILFTSEGSAFMERVNFPVAAEYAVRFRGWGVKVGDEAPKAVLRVDGKDVKTFVVEAPADKQQVYEVRQTFRAGEQRVAVAFVNPFENKGEKDAAKKFRALGVGFIEVEGPFNPPPKPDPASMKLLLTARPKADTAADKRAAAETVLSDFARRAFRRPAKPDEVQRLLKIYDQVASEPFEQGIRLPMKAVLCSPHFLFRVEHDPADPDGVRPLNDFEFAARLSYFLWSSMPDEELFALAGKNELRKPGVLDAQVKRMLKDPKAKALSENFAGQWLQLRTVKTLAPDAGYYPDWDDALRDAMVGEAEAFFEHVVREDRPVTEFLDADYTFANDRLSRHYGIRPRVEGKAFRKVKLPDGRRGGVVTMASTLTVTSNPTRTSPVKRGKWVLENILGTPPPPPAPDVPELPPTGQLKGTLRQQMEQHRANPACATCHAKLDPLGFGLENFDGIGGWRAEDNKQKIDSSGVLPDGARFDGPAQLRKVLLGKSDLFRRCLAEKLLTFGLGRGLEYYDKCALDEIVSATKTDGDRFGALVLAVVKSDPFQKRKGRRSE